MSEKDSKLEIGAKFSNYVENSIELSEIAPVINQVLPKYETIVIEEPNEQQIAPRTSLVEVESSPEEEQEGPLSTAATENGATKLEVTNCKNLGRALNFLKSSSIAAEQDPKHVIFIKIQIDENFEELKANEQNELSDKFRNNSVLIFLALKIGAGKLAIYWKSHEIDYFLTMKPYTDTFSEVDTQIYDFIAAVLVDSLKTGHLGLSNHYQLSDETNRIEIFHISDCRDYNLLLLAGEVGKASIAESLRRLGLDPVKQQGITVQDLALQNAHYDVILALYKQNVPFPSPIVINNCTGEFEKFKLKLQMFHRMVVANDVEKVKELLQQLPRTYCFLNFENESALKVATVSRAFDCYDYLLSQKLRFAPNEIPRQHYDDLQYDDQRIVREIHNKYTQELQEQHINVLIANSFLSHDAPDSEEKLKSVHKAYQTLNANVLIKIILMIVAASKNFKVIFDFNRDSVDVVDPTATSETQGLFYLSGRIYIGAKQLLNEATAHETIATIAHELCHFAMNLVYGNDANPYKKNDNKAIQEFEEISKKCQENSGKEDIIDLVYECYPTDMHHAELIVRVVHLLAFYCNQPEKLAEVRGIFGQLFDFYENRVVPEMKVALPEIKGRDEKEIKKKDNKISKLKKISIISGIFAILAIVAGVCVGIALYKPHYAFHKLSETDQNKVRNAAVNYKCCQVRFQDLFNINSTAYEKLTSDHISQMLNNQPLDFSNPHVHYLDELVRHDWGNLTGKLKEEFLSSNLTFQNESFEFKKLNEKIPKVFEILTSEQIVAVLDGKEMIIDKLIANETDFYVERRFWDDDIYAIYFTYKKSVDKSNHEWETIEKLYKSEKKIKNFYKRFASRNSSIYMQKVTEIKQNFYFKFYFKNLFNEFFGPLFSFKSFKLNFEKILNKTEKSKMFILSAEAGTGKTVTFEQFTIRIKEMFPSRWVSYIDLKDHKRLYNKNESLGNVLGLLEEILGLNSERKFEKEIFEELFEAGEVVLLWNGFDEISPEYSDFIINVLGSIHNNTDSIQFVCTRPLYTDRLRNEFNVHPYTLVPYDKNDQEEFLRKFFIFVKIDEEKIENYTSKVYKIVEALSVKGKYGFDREDFNTPLMLKMLAELVTDEVEINETENIYGIYLKFVRKKIDIWEEKSDFATKFAKNILVEHRKFDMMRIYQKYALINQNFGNLPPHLKILHEEIPEGLASDEISRMGILYINGKYEFKFAHKTFAEFFAAQYFIENIYNAQDVDSEDAVTIIDYFYRTTHDYEYKQVMTTNFMNSFVEIQKPTKNKKFDTKIAEIFRTKFKNFFFDFLQKSKSEIFDFLFHFFKKDHEILVDLLHVSQNETFYTAVFNYAYFQFIDFDLNRTGLKELGQNHLTDDEYEKFIRGRNQKGITLISLYLFYREDVRRKRPRTVYHDEYDLDQEILENKDQFFVLDLIAKNLTESELKELFFSSSSPLTWHASHFVYNESFWEIVDVFLTLQEKKNFIFDLFEIILKDKERLNEIPFLFDKAEEILSETDIFRLFNERNVLHWAFFNAYDADIEQVWNFLVNHTNQEQQKEILLHEVDELCFGYFVIVPNQKCHEAPPLNIPQIVLIRFINSNFTKIYENIFNKTEMQEIILKTNDFLYAFAKENDFEKCKKLANYLKNIFSGNEKLLKAFLLQKIKPPNLNILELLEFDEWYSFRRKPFSDLLVSLNF